MQELLALVALFQKTKFKSSGLMGIILETGSQMERLYEALSNGVVQTDDDAKKAFPEFAKDPNRLHTVKSKLKDRLNDSILLLDFKESAYSDRQKAFFECSKKWAASMILLAKNERLNGISLLEHLLRNTLKFEFTELTLDILRTLRLHYGVLEGNQKKFDEIEAELDRHESIWMKERRAEGYYAELMTRYVRSKSDKYAVSSKAKEYFERVKPFMESCETFKVHLFGRLLELVIYDSVSDYPNTARLCEEALHFFEQKDYNSGIALQVFNYNLFICYLNLREYEKCKTLADKNRELFEEGSYNWYKLQELYFLTALHTGRYTEARDIFVLAMAHPGFEKVPPAIAELWKIFEAYLHFLVEVSLLDADERLNEFKLSRFLNEVPMFSKDKAGMNIPVLIVQFLFALAKGEQDTCIDRVENLAKYRTRYLDEHNALRSREFLKMLEQIPKAGFQRAELEKRTEKSLEQLKAYPLEAANQNYEIELIPYETLWGIVCTRLS